MDKKDELIKKFSNEPDGYKKMAACMYSPIQLNVRKANPGFRLDPVQKARIDFETYKMSQTNACYDDYLKLQKELESEFMKAF